MTKFEFEFNNVRTSNVLKIFKIRGMFYVLCCWMWSRGKILDVWLL